MKINDFASKVTKIEGGKQNLTVAQVSEVLKIVNGQLWGIPYKLIALKGCLGGLFKRACCLIILLGCVGCANDSRDGFGIYEVKRTFNRIDTAGTKVRAERTYASQFKSSKEAIEMTQKIFEMNEPTASEVVIEVKKYANQ